MQVEIRFKLSQIVLITLRMMLPLWTFVTQNSHTHADTLGAHRSAVKFLLNHYLCVVCVFSVTGARYTASLLMYWFVISSVSQKHTAKNLQQRVALDRYSHFEVSWSYEFHAIQTRPLSISPLAQSLGQSERTQKKKIRDTHRKPR